MSASNFVLGNLKAREHVERIRRDRFFIGREEKNPLAEDMHQAVNYLSEELYSKDVHFLMELIQNAEDNEYPSGVAPSLEFVVTSKDITATGTTSTLLIFNNEKGFSPANIESICRVGKSTKKGQRYRGYIGEKGIGFKSVFLVSSQPHIFSNGYQIKFNEEPSTDCEIGYIVPEWVDEHPTVFDLKEVYGSTKVLPTTTIILPLKTEKVASVRKQLSSFHPELLIFLSKIRKLSVKEIGHNNTNQTALTEVSISSEKDYQTRKNVDAESYTLHLDAEEAGKEEQCTYYMWKQKFQVKSECRVKKREEVIQWTITLAFPHGQRLGGAQAPGIYAFLPTEMVTNFPFIIQADFLLASSRETILYDNPWNKGILECVPPAFVNALAALVKSTSDAPAFALPPKFKFLPIQASPLQLLDSVRVSIKNKVLEEHIVPCESFNKKKIFCKPGEVRRLTSQFWNLLDKAQKLGVDLQSISSHGTYVLSSSFDTNEFDDVLGFLEIGYMDWGWYPKCIEGSVLVKEAPEEVYMMLLCFVAEHWLQLGSKIQQIPLLKYEDVRGVISVCSINQITQRGLRLCIATEENLITWLISWNRELAAVSNQFFIPLNTQRCLKGFCRNATVMDWLQRCGKIEVLTAYSYGKAVLRAVNNRKLAIVFAHFLYHSLDKRYIRETWYVKDLCASMPVVDNYGSVVTHRSQVLVPAEGSKWFGLLGSNPWRSENYVELSGDYKKPGNFAGNHTPKDELLTFIQKNVGPADVPYVHPPNARFPTVLSPLTKENAIVLLDWIQKLRIGGVALHSRFIDCVKDGSWLKTSIGYRPPKDSFLSGEMWGPLLQSGSDMVDIPMIDQEFYGNSISNYKNELRLIGVKFEFSEASEMVGRHLMSRAANGTLTRSNVLSLLGLIRFLRDKHLSPSHLIETVKKDRWLKTCLGNRSPTEAFLCSAEWAGASCIANLPFIDEIFYGESILDYKLELELMGVRVRLGDASNYYRLMADNLKLPPNLSTPEAFLLLLKCIRHVGLTRSYLERLKQIKAIKTNLGFRLPTESVLPVLEWDCLFTVLVGIPVLDVQFYGEGIIRTYSPELSKLGVAVRSEEVSKVVSFRFKQLVSSSFFVKDNVLSLLECYKQLKQKEIMLPVDLISCMKMEKWLQTKMGLRAPVDSVLFNSDWDSFLSGEMWGPLLQIGSDMVDIPMIDQEFYGNSISNYKNELRLIGVKFEFSEASEMVGRHLMSRAANGTLTRSNVLSLLGLIRFLRDKHLSPSHLIETVKKDRWLKTCLGNRSPTEAFLCSAEWAGASCIANLPFIDEIFYGESILDYKLELELMGVRVRLGDASNYYRLMADNLKLPPNLSTPEAFLLLLKCIRHVGLTGSYLERLKQIKAIKTNLGFRLPTESVLPVLEWDCLFTVLVGIPVLDVQFYGEGIIRTYSPELSKLGVAVRSEEVSKVVSFRFKQLVSSSFFVKYNVISLLECYKQLKQKEIMLPVDLISGMKMEKWLQTKMGLRAPVDSVLFNSDWDSVAYVATVPFIEYSSDFERYKDELKALGVAVTLQQGAGFVLKGINLPIDPSSMTPSSSLLLLKCIKYWKQYKTDLPKEFMGGINKKWLKTVVGYQCPDESLLFDSKHSSLIQRGDGPFIDEKFYGSEIALYKDQLKEIGVKVDISCGCSLVACHLKRHSKGSTIRRIYEFLREFKWEPENKNLSWIWVPSRWKGGDWVCPKSCVLRDNCNLFDSQLQILDKFYEDDLLGFFSVAFDVKNMPDIEDYMKLWEHWENGTSQVSLDDCLAFWEFIGMHWNPTCEKLLNKHVKKLPVLMGGSISLVSKLDLFIADDLLLWDLFDKSLFVWYPVKSTQSLPRSKLTCIYTSLGVRKFSEAVEKQESYASDSEGADNGTTVKSSVNLVKEGLLRIILAFLSNPCLDICAAKRHEMVESLLNLTIIEADEPVRMQYKITLSGGRQLEAKTTRMFRWERNESRLFMRGLDQLQGMEGRIRFATYISDEISKGLLFERADLRDSLAELIKVGCLLDYELTAVGFLLKNQNLQVFSEDEEFLSRSSRKSYAVKFACSISVISILMLFLFSYR